jgi:hypothetical protein
LPVCVIFKGTGAKVSDADQRVMEKHASTVKVLWQENAWNCVSVEKQSLKATWRPFTKSQPQAEFLMVQDNLSIHRDPQVLEYLKERTRTFTLFLPPNTTNYIQMVDDNIGKAFRELVYNQYYKFEEAFDWIANPQGKVPAVQKRKLMIQWISNAAKQWNQNHVELGKAAATRVGMRMTLNHEGNTGIIPVRFPKDYAASLVPTHPLYNDVEKPVW